MDNILRFKPTVFAVENEYQIFVPVMKSCVMWVKVGGKCYYDHSNGVLKSDTLLHKITVPVASLDAARGYTVCYRVMIERKPYFSQTSGVYEIDFAFSPLPESTFRAYQIADAHGMVDAPCRSAKLFEEKYGKIDLLILNGDVINHSGNLEYFDTFFAISERITGGEVPVIFSRGNHDTRGIYAEKIADYSPTRGGRSYFTFRLGSLWGIVLDCGEDKDDSNEEYGNTNCCAAFREEESLYLDSIVANAKDEYLASGVEYRLLVAHNPFTRKYSFPFNIEEERFADWVRVMNEDIRPDVFIAGHLHTLNIIRPGDENDAYGQAFTTVVASKPDNKAGTFIGGGLIFDSGRIRAVFASESEILAEELI